MKSRGQLFTSYAHDDRTLAEKLILGLEHHLKCCTRTDSELWIDRHILSGEEWDSKIKTALQTAELGLLLVSPAFLCSGYINKVEVPVLLETGCIPVGLKPIDLDIQLPGSLKSLQLYRYHAPRSGPLFFSQCNATQGDAFILELYQQIVGRIAVPEIAKIP